jgi:hypothetical protein
MQAGLAGHESAPKGVVTFTDIGDINLQAFAEMVTAIAAGLESGRLVAR